MIQNGGARLAPELRSRLRARFGCLPQEIYGTAEGLINMVPLNAADEHLLHSSGMPVCEDDEIKVVDDAGKELPDGVQGELATRGPYTIRGYYRAPEKNAEAFMPDGFYRMGDIVRKQGRYVYTEGRKKDLINRGGEKISCEEVENLIFAHPKVKAVTLVAMPDPVFGEKGLRLRHRQGGTEPRIRRTDRLPQAAAHRQLQAARAARAGERIPGEPGRKDPQAAIARGDRGEDGAGEDRWRGCLNR